MDHTLTSKTLAGLPATELARLIALGEISSVEAVEAHIARIEEVNPALNAVIFKTYETAQRAAQEADRQRTRGETLGPLHGVPITIKESLEVTGTPSTFGLPSLAKTSAKEDELHVARLREAGAIILGKTNVAQLLFYFESDNPLYGRTNNPWNLERTPGGSSGGEAAIIAAGGSSLGLGTDLGGSLRVPANFCGIASLKPTAGRTPDLGRYSLALGQRAIASQVGVLGRKVADVALGTRIINGGSNPQVEPPQPLGDPAKVDISKLRVAYYTEDATFKTAPAIRRAVNEAAEILKGFGAQVTPWTPPATLEALKLTISIFSADGGRGLNQILGRNKRDPRVGMLVFLAGRSRPSLAIMGGLLRLMGQRGMAANLRAFGHRDTLHYWRLVEEQLAYQERFKQALDQAEGGPFDLMLGPVSPLPAFTHGACRDLVTAGDYTLIYNLLGYPAGVVPVTRVQPGEELGREPSGDIIQKVARKVEQGSAGLPVGVQVAARPWREHQALAAMQAIEQVASTRPGFPSLPPL